MKLTMGDTRSWSFVHGTWTEEKDGTLSPQDKPSENAEEGMQGYRFAFLKDSAYSDLQARLEVQHIAPHSDAGLIFRAKNKREFYVLHFPCCGQAFRAQHFWAALSKMDEDGYLRIQKLHMVARVASNTKIWHSIEVDVRGERMSVRIDGTGVFEHANLETRPGNVGLFSFGRAVLRGVSLAGERDTAFRWDDSGGQPTNWFHPCESTVHGKQQKPQTLVRTPGGELLLWFLSREEASTGKMSALVTRSADDGRTWSMPEPVSDSAGASLRGRLHLFPDGKFRYLSMRDEQYYIQEVSDDVSSFAEPKRLALGPTPKGVPSLHWGPQVFTNLADGTTVMFLYGGHVSSVKEANIHTWGSHHCQAYASCSRDNGYTWSELKNIDGATDGNGEPVEGSFDLTEVCGVETEQGKIMALIRPIYSPWMWEVWSKDGGASWGPCMRGPFPGYATPNMLKTSSGAILVAHRLPGLTIHASFDGGITWDEGTTIDSALWVMGSMLEVRPDLVLYVHNDSFRGKMRGEFIRVTRKRLEPVKREEV